MATQKTDRLEPGQIFRNNRNRKLVKIKTVLLDKAEVSLEPADREISPYEMDISDFLRQFHLA